MYNKQYNRTELYYEKASRIGSFNFFRKFAGEFKVAYEDVNGLLALYHLERGTLNVYGFDETRSNLFIRNANIEIRLWYNNMLPELSQILFITGTEYLCFVEVDGRVRVYSLITGQFQPADGKFPPNGEVRCSPDGTCLIAFVGKENYCSLDTEGVSPESTPSNQQHDDDDNDDDDRIFISQSTTTLASANKADSDTGDVDAHVYFVKDLKAASKVLTLNGIGNIGAIKITALRGLQPHLLYVKTSHKYFASKILKITVERDLWRFNATNKAAVNLGKVRFGTDASKQDNQLIEGNSTHFSKIINHGDVLLIRGERRTVREILDDMHLVIEGAFPSSLAVGYQDGFLDFKVEPKPNSNGYVDCYAAVYERYPVESCIQDNTNRMASSANTLHIILGISRQQSVDANYPVRFSKHITGTFRRLINQTNKPASSLQYFTTETESIENLNIIHFCQLSKKQEIGQWLIQMACLIPIQIAVAVGGHFVPLKDGLITDIDAILGGNANLAAVSKAITFGWYESIFNFYGDSDVKVVSSMGEQSTGKSYILNHLCGTTFDGSAQVSNKSVWMSTVPTKETLYVVMDFEGLRSLERTPQEDMFLTLFNAAASNLILYKNNFAIGRDISSMFHSFQAGATIFDPSNTLKMFTARLAIIIKDVPKPDRAGIAAEFESKFNETVRKEADRNFISQLYQGELSIMPLFSIHIKFVFQWPLFNEPSFYTTLAKLKTYLNKQEPKFGKARTFLPTIKIIMAKLKTCDWSSLDDSMVRIRASAVRLLIKQVVASGAEEVEPTLEALKYFFKNLDTGDIIEDNVVTLRDLLDSETSESMVNEQEIIPDSGLILLPDPDGVFSDFTAPLRNFFEDNAQRRFDVSNDADWYKLYNAFVKQIVARRIRRAKQWFSANTSRFPSDHTDIVATAYDLEQESDRLKAVWSLCGLTCAECNLRCLEQRDHSGEHTCFTDHSCKHACAFTQDHFSDGSMDSSQSPPCAMPAGHDGTHICKDSEHVCGETCSLYGKRNCQGTCNKQPDHTDSIHSCASRVHYCGEPCSLRDVKDSKSASRFSCKNTCIVPYEESHEIHKCENDNACPLRCCLLQCNKRCDTSNHFHAIDNAGDYHFCGDEHQCFEECKSKGICEIQNQPREQQENYVNKHGTFSYVKYVQTSRRLTCYKKIPVGKFTHAGTHVHGATDMNTGDCFHYCETKCPFCEYYCTLPFGHQQAEHETSHGNMIQTVFSAVDEEFEHEGFIFNTGDRGNSFLCNMYCKGLGRHRHIDYCKTTNTGTEPPASCKADGIQHITKKINPDPECPKDFVKHSLYWKRTGFADPYTNEEKELYEKCDVMCSGEEHQLKPSQNNSASSGGGPSSDTAAPKSYCELPLFHAPLFTPPNSATGYVDVDGHYFKCQKPAKSRSDFHIIFVIDRSSSMDASDRKPLRNTPVEAKLRATHNNRLGAVYDAVIRFVDTRHSTLRNRAGVSAATSSNDTLSLVLFGSKAKTVYTNRKLSGSAGLIEEMIKHHPSGATNFAAAIKQATDICVKNYDQSRAKPYLITVLFGSISGSQVLESMAEFADQYHNKTVAAKEPKSLLSRILLMTTTNASDSLQCRFYTALDEVKLAECFTGIAKSLTDYKPALMARR
ncbi:hypothetical protein BC938DRAFT_480113 [Jimgerdemannia flammicorona]|uniref:VWFA domain-containing protein n=1 Tax=Jimgerdemannia flammicorona TaxID=994334 RepID=A0A433QJC8_9FUNG|nr:hypothetical protein BC938DRAFT_480113 [Jimgerdemannia flammicorona]